MTSAPLVIGIDSSTTSTKAVVAAADGSVLAQAAAPVTMSTPGMDRYEQDPREWWSSTRDAVRGAVAALSEGDRGRITALCITPQRQTFAPVDADGEPLRPGILWLDGRAVSQVERLGSEHVHRLSGFQPDVTPSLYKIAWLAEHEPETLHRAARITGVHGHLVHALTGRWVDSVATADSLGLLDMERRRWSEELVELAGLRPDQLPELVEPGAVIGPVLAAVADDLGLPAGVSVVAGCGDGQAAALGCGAVGPDVAYLNLGTALVSGVHSSVYRTADVHRTDVAGLPDQYVLEVVQNSGSYLAGWFRSELGDPTLGGRPDPALDEAASQVPIGSRGLLTLPYWNAVQSPHWDPVARGAMVGFGGGHTRPEMYRSILEGISLETARNLRRLQESTGCPLSGVRIMGGGQRSPLWRQMMADCLGLPLTLCHTEEVSALGAAMMAMTAVGAHPSLAAAARAMSRPGDDVPPEPARHGAYRELDAIHARLYPALRDTFAAQATLAARLEAAR